MNRRTFLRTSSAAALATPLVARAEAPAISPLIFFSKSIQTATFDRTAEVVADVGWQGIELPLRAKGQVLPERVEEDLPKMVEALKKRGLVVGLITTDITGTDSPLAEKVLKTAKALGITRYRMGITRYDLDKPIKAQLDELKPRCRDLAAMNKQLGVRGGWQNHSGAKYVGCTIWDLHELMRDLDPAALGVCFDIGHATLEGGKAWEVDARLILPWITCVYVKDFAWERGAKGGFEPKWGPLGSGAVRREFFDWLKKSGYRGPISQHCEYLTGDGPEQVAQYKKDCTLLREWLA
ncbi:MAG: sugar phosphate isomerase/epimerase family protein [Chthoniobacteraceae bacterium]